MTFVITSACIDVMDKSCVDVCPVDCIFTEADDRMCFIEPNTCIDCDACAAACPVGAIFRDSDVPRAVRSFIDLNAGWFKDKESTRALVARWADEGPP